jgi:hypothetical protein
VRNFWQQFEGDRPTFVVVADSAIAAVQDALEGPVTVNEYVSRDWDERLNQHQGSPDQKALIRYLLARRYTSLADIVFVKRVYEQRLLSERSTVLHAKDSSVRAFHSGNHVLVGSQRAIPWVRLFEESMDFRLRGAPEDFGLSRGTGSAAVIVENRKPQTGESAEYRSKGRDSSGSEAFAIIACLPNLARSGNVLILAGSEASGTEAAGTLVTDEAALAALLRQAGQPRTTPPYFEALLRIRHVLNTRQRSEVVALHVH